MTARDGEASSLNTGEAKALINIEPNLHTDSHGSTRQTLHFLVLYNIF